VGGQPVRIGSILHVDAKLYDPRAADPLLAAAKARSLWDWRAVTPTVIMTPRLDETQARMGAGARAAGKDPSAMQYWLNNSSRGDRVWAKTPRAVAIHPKAFKAYYNMPTPGISASCRTRMPLEKSPTLDVSPSQVHIKKIEDLWDSGASIVNIHVR